jgi:hypothetical protein
VGIALVATGIFLVQPEKGRSGPMTLLTPVEYRQIRDRDVGRTVGPWIIVSGFSALVVCYFIAAK